MNKLKILAPDGEQFDINRVEVEGIVQSIWERSGSVFFRLVIFPELRIALETPDYRFATCRLTGGLVGDQAVSLLPGDQVRVVGLLVDAPYKETLRQFLAEARAPDFLESVPNQTSWSAVQVPRIATLVEVRELVPVQGERGGFCNHVCVQGVVAKVWERGGNLLARLAIYDEHTTATDQTGNHNRPRRIPHYATALFIEGKAGDREVHVEAKNRLRVTGYLTTRLYRESLKEILLRSRNLALRNDLPNSDRVEDICDTREATYVVVQSAILFTRLPAHSRLLSASSNALERPAI